MISIIEWISVYDKLPKTEVTVTMHKRLAQRIGHNFEKWDRSTEVLCLAQDMERPEFISPGWLQYVKNWKDMGLQSAWVQVDLSSDLVFYNVDWWSKGYGKPQDIQVRDFEKGKNKYSLEQLRGAWGAGFYKGSQAE